MKGVLIISGREYEVDFNDGHDISLGISPDGSTSCFGAKAPNYMPMKGEGWVAKVAAGGSVNAFEVHFNPHAHGTHTECLGHISEEHHELENMNVGSHFLARLISVEPEKKGTHQRITREMVDVVMEDEFEETAVIIRTLPNTEEKIGKDYSNTNPAFMDPEAARALAERGIMHIVIDLPSVDPESDGGALKAHKGFWNWPTYQGRQKATITEMVYVDDAIEDGLYLLNLQRASFHLDCAPSRPILYPLRPRKTTN